MRIWGCSSFCSKDQLLAESPLIDHTDWKQYIFKFKPNRNYQYFMLEAFYKTPNLMPYNGNIILDKASDIVEIPCPEKNELANVEVVTPQKDVLVSVIDLPSGQNNKNTSKASVPSAQNNSNKINSKNDTKQEKNIATQNSNKDKIIKELDKDKIRVGQTIKIENLYFKADSANINPNSYDVLNEIYEFLKENKDVIIEIGGHTNGIPNSQYCNQLSSERAKNVAEYLYSKGISKSRIKYRGYGKLKPLASDKTLDGRQKNQRVEIKILNIGNKAPL
ncbi:MAG: OmpA family protein [Saprospiraceae bacterium]